jgi:capsular exopolysaccharide synthesis family protein
MKEQKKNDTVNLRALFLKLASRWYLFLLTILIAVACAYTYLRFTPKVYSVKASLLLNDNSKDTPTSEQFLKGSGMFMPKTQIEDEIGILTSFKLIRETMERMDFRVSYYSVNDYMKEEVYRGDFPFKVEIDLTKPQMINVPIHVRKVDQKLYQVQIEGKNVEVFNLGTDKPINLLKEVQVNKVVREGKVFTDKYLNFTLIFNNNSSQYDKDDYYFIIHSLDQLAGGYQGKLVVQPISREANIIELQSKGFNVGKEINFINTLLEVYFENELEKKGKIGEKTVSFIDKQLGVVKGSLDTASQQRANQQRESGVINTGLTTETLTRRLSDLETQRAQIQARLSGYEFMVNSLRSSDAVSISQIEDPSLSDLLQKYSALIQERARLQGSVGEEHPSFKQNKAQIDQMKGALIGNVNALVSQTRLQLNSISNSIANTNSSIRQVPQADLNLLNLTNKFNVNESIYSYLLEKRAEAGIAIETNMVNKEVLDNARMEGDGPISPKGTVVYMMAFILGLLIPIALIVIKDSFNDKILNQSDIELNTNIPTLGVIGYSDKTNNPYIVANNSKSALAESFRSIRVNLQYLFLDTNKKVIAVTSSSQGEGKTFCATNLSVIMAQSGKKTLLIDTDLRKPRVAARFNIDNTRGLATYLTGMHEAKDVIQETEVENLHIITSGPIPANPLNLIGGNRMEPLMAKLRKEYDYIILDTPPLGLVSDFLILMNYSDFNIYIVRHKQTERYALNKINELYDTNKIKNVGILINGVKSMSAYGYSDKAYKYGYGD